MGKRLIITFSMMFLLIVILAPTVDATSATVIISLEQESIVYEIKLDGPNVVLINGTISCLMDGLGKDVQYVTVDIFLGDGLGWTAGGPYFYKFYSNGTKNFTAQITIPFNTDNRTTNRVVVSGHWEAKTHPMSIYQNSGEAQSDAVDITVIRYYSLSDGKMDTTEDAGILGWFMENIQFIYLFLLILIPIIIIVVVYYIKYIHI